MFGERSNKVAAQPQGFFVSVCDPRLAPKGFGPQTPPVIAGLRYEASHPKFWRKTEQVYANAVAREKKAGRMANVKANARAFAAGWANIATCVTTWTFFRTERTTILLPGDWDPATLDEAVDGRPYDPFAVDMNEVRATILHAFIGVFTIPASLVLGGRLTCAPVSTAVALRVMRIKPAVDGA